jgi:hypothetical protein
MSCSDTVHRYRTGVTPPIFFIFSTTQHNYYY